jgi:hypothetical protein
MKESWAFSENPSLYDEFWASPNRRVQKTCERSNTHRIGYVSAPPCAAWRHALSGRMWKPPPVCVRRGEHAHT